MSLDEDRSEAELLLLRQQEALQRILDAAASEHVHALAREALGMDATEAEIDRRRRLPQTNTRITVLIKRRRRLS